MIHLNLFSYSLRARDSCWVSAGVEKWKLREPNTNLPLFPPPRAHTNTDAAHVHVHVFSFCQTKGTNLWWWLCFTECDQFNNRSVGPDSPIDPSDVEWYIMVEIMSVIVVSWLSFNSFYWDFILEFYMSLFSLNLLDFLIKLNCYTIVEYYVRRHIIHTELQLSMVFRAETMNQLID